MTDTPTPILLFTINSAPAAEIAQLDSNYGDVKNAIPADIQSGLTKAGRPLSGAQAVDILAAKTDWLVSDGTTSFYEVKAADQDLNVYQITPGVASVLKTQAKMACGVMSLNIVTAACHAILNTQLLTPKTKPSWFDDLNTQLDVAKALAKEWVNDLAPEMTAALPNQVIDYGTTYSALTAQIVEIAEANPTAKGKDNQAVREVFALVDALKTQVGVIHGDTGSGTGLEGMDAKLTEWGDKMQAAHDNLYKGVANIQAAETDLQSDIDKMNSAIAGLQATIDGENKAIAAAAAAIGIGIFIAIIGVALVATGVGALLGGVVIGLGVAGVIGGAVTWGIMQHKINEQFGEIADDQKEKTEDQQQLVALQGLSVASNQALSSIALATSALSAVKTMWKLFEGELQGVLDKLNQANDGMMLIVSEAFINGSAEEWALAAGVCAAAHRHTGGGRIEDAAHGRVA